MDEYKKPYLTLWNGIDKALKEIERCNYGVASDFLKQAQADAEEAYISEGEDT